MRTLIHTLLIHYVGELFGNVLKVIYTILYDPGIQPVGIY